MFNGKEKLKEIKMIVFDIDGVLTDGKIEIDENGYEKKNIALADLDYMNKLKKSGYILVAITGEDTPICSYFEKRYPWDRFYKGCKEKDKMLKQVVQVFNVSIEAICYIGDGIYDVPALGLAGIGVCPQNAVQEAKEQADIVLYKSGGDGCVEELYNMLTRMDEKCLTMPTEAFKQEIDSLIIRYPILCDISEEIGSAYKLLETAYQLGGKLLVAGNGGSAADAEHIVAELMKKFKKERPISNELSVRLCNIDKIRGAKLSSKLEKPLTAISLTTHESLSSAFLNDVDGSLVFAQKLLGYGKEGDVLLAISTSGNSENVLNATVLARAMGIKVIGLTGGTGGELAKLADCAVVVPESETYKIQELHLPIYHCWCLMLEETFWGKK